MEDLPDFQQKLEDSTIDFPIDARWASFAEFDIQRVTFTKPVDFTNSTFFGRLRFIDSKFISQVTFHLKTGIQAKYKARLRFLNKDPNAAYYRVFGKDAYLQQVDFVKSDRVLFQQIDLANVYFRGTNLRGARFLDANWWQNRLGRNSLYDELFFCQPSNGPLMHNYLPSIEETYRNIRFALEENRSFAIATDFYIGEMEAQRRQLSFSPPHFFSVTAWYNALSRYGTRPYKAARFLFFLGVLHFSLTALIQKVPTTDVWAVLESYLAYTICLLCIPRSRASEAQFPSWSLGTSDKC